MTVAAKTSMQAADHSSLHNRETEGTANVLAYGAKGDGVTDDTAAFQTAINTGKRVYLPRPPSHYLITNKLTITSAYGAHIFGDIMMGTGPRILCNNFPGAATTDVIEMTHTSFPALQLENLYFNNTAGNKPRDFFRQTVSDNHSMRWKNVYIEGMGGYGFNSPVGILNVGADFQNCHFVSNAGGGVFINGNAISFRHCRFVANANFNNGIDVEIPSGVGITLDNPTFDGYAPGSFNYTRMKATNVGGLVMNNPYVEWTSAAATGSLRNFSLNNCNSVVISGGAGGVAPSGGTLIPIDVQSGSNIVLLEPPIQRWGGTSATTLNIANCTGLVGFIADTASKIAVDSASKSYVTIYNSGQLLRQAETAAVPNLTGATPSCQNATYGVLTNAAPQNMTNLLGGTQGHKFTLWANDGNTTLKHSSGGEGQMLLRGAADFALASGNSINLFYLFGAWYEETR